MIDIQLKYFEAAQTRIYIHEPEITLKLKRRVTILMVNNQYLSIVIAHSKCLVIEILRSNKIMVFMEKPKKMTAIFAG